MRRNGTLQNLHPGKPVALGLRRTSGRFAFFFPFPPKEVAGVSGRRRMSPSVQFVCDRWGGGVHWEPTLLGGNCVLRSFSSAQYHPTTPGYTKPRPRNTSTHAERHTRTHERIRKCLRKRQRGGGREKEGVFLGSGLNPTPLVPGQVYSVRSFSAVASDYTNLIFTSRPDLTPLQIYFISFVSSLPNGFDSTANQDPPNVLFPWAPLQSLHHHVQEIFFSQFRGFDPRGCDRWTVGRARHRFHSLDFPEYRTTSSRDSARTPCDRSIQSGHYPRRHR